MVLLILMAVTWSVLHVTEAMHPTAPVAMSAQGGGFRAFSTDAGFIAGMLSFVGKQQNLTHPTFSGTGLLSRFDLFSTVSGSSWFFPELAYSTRFHTLMEDIAANPQNTSAFFKKQWWDPFKSAAGVSPSIFDPRRDIAEALVTKLFGKADEDTLFTLQFILSTHGTFNEFVQLILSSTASIDRDMKLSAPVDQWAQGKVWLADHTVLLPSSDKQAFLFKADGKTFFQQVTYEAGGSGSIPLMLPAKFSVTLGGGSSQDAPYPYIAPGAAPGLDHFKYNGVVVPIIDKPSATSGPLGSDLAGGALSKNSGNLPIWGASTASSAAFGLTAVLRTLEAELETVLKADLAPWVSSAQDGASFVTGLDLVRKLGGFLGVNAGNVKALASGAVHAVLDGGNSDATGISYAVATGATEIVALLNSNATCNALSIVESLFKGGPEPEYPLTPREFFPAFETPASSAQEAIKNFHELHLTPQTKFLKKFTAGSLQATTADNKFFGISGGRLVTIHIVNMCSDLNLGDFEKYVNYGTLAQEIAMAINAKENERFAQNTLLPMLLKSRAVREAKNTPTIV